MKFNASGRQVYWRNRDVSRHRILLAAPIEAIRSAKLLDILHVRTLLK